MYCAKSPDTEWSGVLFYEIEGDFDSDNFKIICRDFLLNDVGSSTFTEFDDKGQAIDYIAEKPELMSCYFGLTHSHNRMATFFSGTDTSTLQKEGFDRNNFVSLIVNNEGTYSAAITRKVEYTEKHEIEISGKYPFFGTRRICEIPASHSHDEKVKTIIEYFPLVVEKTTANFSPNEYEERFNKIMASKVSVKKATPFYSWPSFKESTQKTMEPDYDDSLEDYYANNSLDYKYPHYSGYSSSYEKYKYGNKSEKTPEVIRTVAKQEDLLLFKDDIFDEEEVKNALALPVYKNKLNMLFLQIITGSPIIDYWVDETRIDNRMLNSVVEHWKKVQLGLTGQLIPFLYDSIQTAFGNLDTYDYFPDNIANANPDAFLENVLIIKMINLIGELEQSDILEEILEAFKEFYSV